MSNAVLTREQQHQYERDGFLVLRNHIDDAKLRRLDLAIERHVPGAAYAPGKIYPEPAKYTVCRGSLADPDLAFIVEDDAVVGPSECLLGAEAHLTAYVAYVRTPGDVGSKAHNDYKRWRPVGSSMNWLFTILPLTDFDDEAGPLLVAPGSHQLEKVNVADGWLWERRAPERPEPEAFVDAELKRGDLLLMNMYTWHEAPANRSRSRRIGLFNKYCAANAPPATGYFIWQEDAYNALSPKGRRLLAVHSDREIRTARIALTRSGANGREVALVRDGADAPWMLPGTSGWEEQLIPGWDHGNRIGTLDAYAREHLGVSLPWMTYVGDFEEGEGLCRVYAYPLQALTLAPPTLTVEWFAEDALPDVQQAFLGDMLSRWRDPDIIRGKGLTQAQSKVDQYAP